MSSDDDIAGTQATVKSPKHAGGVHIVEIVGACKFTSGQTDLTTYVVECIVISHEPRGGALKQADGSIVGWAQPSDKNHKPAIKGFCVQAAKALAVAKGAKADDVTEASVTGQVIAAMFPKGNENKSKSPLRGLRFRTDSTPRQSDKGAWVLVLWEPLPEQPTYAAAQAAAAVPATA